MIRNLVTRIALVGLTMALQMGTARTSVAQEVVGLTAVESQGEAALVFDLGDGNSLLLALKDGAVVLGGTQVASYTEGGVFEEQWRSLVKRADLGIAEVIERLVGFELAEGTTEEFAGVHAMKEAVASLAATEARFAETVAIADAHTSRVDISHPASATTPEPVVIQHLFPVWAQGVSQDD